MSKKSLITGGIIAAASGLVIGAGIGLAKYCIKQSEKKEYILINRGTEKIQEVDASNFSQTAIDIYKNMKNKKNNVLLRKSKKLGIEYLETYSTKNEVVDLTKKNFFIIIDANTDVKKVVKFIEVAKLDRVNLIYVNDTEKIVDKIVSYCEVKDKEVYLYNSEVFFVKKA